MAGRLSVYLDTSVFSAYYDERNLERMLFTRDFWNELKVFRLYISDLTLDELSAHPDPSKRELLFQLTSNFEILDSKATNNLVQEYIKYRGINILVSWNFQHIVKRKTRRMIAMVNSLLNYPIPEIVSPLEI